jgi:hypothetical protein
MTTNEPTAKSEPVPEYICMYFEHQYDRMAKLENQAMTITNVVVTLTVVAFTFGFGDLKAPKVSATISLSVVVVLANLFAIFYTVRTSSWIRTHKLRAKRVLEKYTLDLYELDQTTFAPGRSGILGMGRRKIQIILHALLAIASAVIPLILHLL